MCHGRSKASGGRELTAATGARIKRGASVRVRAGREWRPMTPRTKRCPRRRGTGRERECVCHRACPPQAPAALAVSGHSPQSEVTFRRFLRGHGQRLILESMFHMHVILRNQTSRHLPSFGRHRSFPTGQMNTEKRSLSISLWQAGSQSSPEQPRGTEWPSRLQSRRIRERAHDLPPSLQM